MCKKQQNKYSIGIVENNIHLQGDYYLLEVSYNKSEQPENRLSKPLPGQFYQLKPITVRDRAYTGSLLYKPLSVYDCSDESVTFMIKVIGEGTRQIADTIIGDRISLLGPLGKSFTIEPDKNVLLISGGIGYAPLYYLRNELVKQNNRLCWLHGGRSSADIFPADIICTDDGSQGSKGFITNCLPEILAKSVTEKIDMIYCCGPKAMMKVVYEHCREYGVDSQFSLEEYMACGIGVCLGCAVKVKYNNEEIDNSDNYSPYKMICRDGAVFNGEEIDWYE